MPRLTCRCGESFSLSLVPHPQGFKLLWEPSREKLIEDLIAPYSFTASDLEFEDKVYQLLYPKNPEFPQVYECPHCGRLAVFAKASDSKPALWFEREKIQGDLDDSLRSLVDEKPRDRDGTQIKFEP
ncbi:MAG: hypothetical protein HC941_30005 [Microcoleus sp. SU_5_3]|nr:hypothetical protein [Microcoleus sp. SU_5_3]NJL68120.1 hypothetical protein [Microcoleus sp. SM1_3_4]